MEKKLITPPEILCKKMPIEFSYYFHYCRNLKFEDRPDYNMLKKLFMDVLVSRINLKEEFLFDWFDEDNSYMERKRLELNSSESGRIADLKEDKKKKNGKNLIEEYIKEESREESNIKNDYPKFKQNNDIMNDLLNNQKAEKNGENLIDDAQSNEKKDSDKDKNSKSTGSFQIINKKSEEK